MPDICPKCGLPTEVCVCQTLERATESKILVYTKKTKFHKLVTVVDGLPAAEAESTAKSLKRILACGGTSRNSVIELQGNHVDAAKRALISIGYNPNSIDTSG